MSESLAADPDEHLTDGWEPDTPESDTLVRAAVEIHAAWLAATAEAKGRPWRRTDSWVGAYIGDRGELTNVVMPLRPTDADGFATLLGEVAELVPPTAPYVLLSAFPTPDLSWHGLVRVGHPPLMARPGRTGTRGTPAGVEVREVGDGATTSRWPGGSSSRATRCPTPSRCRRRRPGLDRVRRRRAGRGCVRRTRCTA